MKTRLTFFALAGVTLAALGGGIAALRYVPDLPAPVMKVAEAVHLRPALSGRPRAAQPPAAPALRHVYAAPIGRPAPQEPPPSTITALEALPPVSALPHPDETPPDVEAEDSVQGEVSLTPPLPPARPRDLAQTPSTPTPPRRPADLATLIQQPSTAAKTDPLPTLEDKPQPLDAAAAPPLPVTPPSDAPAPAQADQATVAPSSAPVVTADVPLPPMRPANLAGPAITRMGDGTGALQQVARLPEPATTTDVTEPEARFGVGSPVFIRIFKQEGQLQLYLRKTNGRFALYKTYPICKWSGHLGPKLREADYQSPEGFYSVSAKQLHPKSNYHRAFNVGYPNAFDRQNGRTGGLVMVHGSCKSVGCFAMTDAGIEEIYGFVDAALRLGQKEIPVHIFPFHMTESALAHETGGNWLAFASASNGAQWAAFWRNLKEGYDLFEQTGEPPVAYACGDHYSFGAAGAGCQRVAGW